MILLILAMATASACGSDAMGPADEADPELVGELAFTAGGLQAGTTYYWKLEASAPGVMTLATETVTFSFTTDG
jgi:hypothetical protein